MMSIHLLKLEFYLTQYIFYSYIDLVFTVLLQMRDNDKVADCWCIFVVEMWKNKKAFNTSIKVFLDIDENQGSTEIACFFELEIVLMPFKHRNN